MSRIGPLALTLALGLAIAGCAGDRTQEANEPEGRSAELDPTNTAVNERDRAGTTPTPDDQSANEHDMTLTQAIRQAVVEDKSLSTDADNIKIVTVDGKVTLRGPVKSEAERTAIAVIAQRIAGTTPVENQLEVAPGD
jgi:hyperosmotically inducible periplasmic protein